MSTFGGPQDRGDRVYGQAYVSGADSPESLIERRSALVDMGIIMTAEQAVAVRYERSSGSHEEGDLFYNNDLSVWPMTTGPSGAGRADTSAMLNPASYFIAMRFKGGMGLYNEKNPKILLWCKDTNKAVVVLRTDYGPHQDTGRDVDMSDGAADALLLEPGDGNQLPTDSLVYFTWAPDDAPLGPVTMEE